MIHYPEALHQLEALANSRPRVEETVALNDALGRILARPIQSQENVPGWNNSAMDGFAVVAAETQSATPEREVRIEVHGSIVAGDAQAHARASTHGAGTAIEIMTGAPMPQGGHDAVVRVEDVRIERGKEGSVSAIVLVRPVRAGENVRLQGSDYKPGQLVLEAGQRIGPEHVMACAGLGVTRLPVWRRPRVAVISTGSELMPADTQDLQIGMIRNSSGPYLLAALAQWGVEVRDFGIVGDDPRAYQAVIEVALRWGADVTISTGAVSMGIADFVPQVLENLGAQIVFHKAAIRPGKPILFADLDRVRAGSVFFGAPGNPVSTAVALRFFVQPYIRALLGLARETGARARLTAQIAKPAGLRCFYKGKLQTDELGTRVTVLAGQGSAIVSTLVEANCWVVLLEGGAEFPSGQTVECFALNRIFENGAVL